MKANRIVGWCVVAAVLLTPALARSETAEQAFAKGEASLAKADFAAALALFAKAARADLDNREYLQHYLMVRRILDLRSRLAAAETPRQEEQIAQALRAFYLSEKLHSEALALDKRMHEKLNTTTTATMLADTQLAMNLNADAAKLLSAIEDSQATAATRALLGIALARTGKTDEAKRLAAAVVLPKEGDPGLYYLAARLHALIGDSAKAADVLKRGFEFTPPSQLDAFKAHAKTNPDLASLITNAAFAKALAAESQIAESKCSGGSSCANCPMRGKCPASQGQK